MNFVVIYQRAAEDVLAAARLESSDRAQLTAAAHDLDLALSTNPREHGESRSGNTRVAFHPPLVALFEVDEKLPLVVVHDLRYRPR